MANQEPLVPIWQKTHLTLGEAVAYTGVGRDKMIELSEQVPHLVIWNGKKRLFRRKRLDEYLETVDTL